MASPIKNEFDLGALIRRPEFGAFMGLVFVYVFFEQTSLLSIFENTLTLTMTKTLYDQHCKEFQVCYGHLITWRIGTDLVTLNGEQSDQPFFMRI